MNAAKTPDRGPWLDVLSLYSLGGFAIGQPVYSLLTQYPQFFAARKAGWDELLWIVAGLSLAVPTILAVLEFAAALMGEKFRQFTHGIFTSCLSFLFMLTLFSKVSFIDGGLALVSATIIGAGIGTIYHCRSGFRGFFSFLAITIVAFPVLFLMNPTVRRGLATKGVQETLFESEDTPNVVMVVFDEFPLSSLLDETGQIDGQLYPNFAQLAKESHWFVNATTNSPTTTAAIPSILSGMYPRQKAMPTIRDYPENLFSILSSDYELRVHEQVTNLSPVWWHEDEEKNGFVSTIILGADLGVLYLHVVTPSDFASKLPALHTDWKNFLRLDGGFFGTKKEGQNRESRLKRFIHSLTPAPNPCLYFLHTLLPHRPWEYYPSGKRYGEVRFGNVAIHQWKINDYFVLQNYRRHLLQVGFTDKILGDIIQKLKSEGLYDSSLLVITADHGISFNREDMLRGITDTNYFDVLPVPLFLKRPFQKEGILSERNVESVDLLPTILAAIGKPVPSGLEGVSAFDTTKPERPEKRVYIPPDSTEYRSFSGTFNERNLSLQRKLAAFGSGGPDANGLLPFGDWHHLIGRRVKELNHETDSSFSYILDSEFEFNDVNPRASILPAFVSGTISQGGDKQKSTYFAISVNGIIGAVTRPFETKGVNETFFGILPENSFIKGKNEIRVLAVRGTQENPILVSPAKNSTAPLFLTSEVNGRKALKSKNGKEYLLTNMALEGLVEEVYKRGDKIIVSGWAIDRLREYFSVRLIFFAGGKSFFMGETTLRRLDIAFNTGMAFTKPGFEFQFPAELRAMKEFHIFMVSGEGAREIQYAPDFQNSGESFQRNAPTFALTKGRGGGSEYIVTNLGQRYPLVPRMENVGWLDSISVKDGTVRIGGWAFETKRGKRPRWILGFYEERLLFSLKNNAKRPDVAKYYGPEAIYSGFKGRQTIGDIEEFDTKKVRMIFISDRDIAFELKYHKNR